MNHTPLLKYCGIHSFEDLLITSSSQASYLGFNFYKESRRYASPENVSMWLDRLPAQPKQQLVGIFVNASLTEIIEIVQKVPLDIIQCHGDESAKMLDELKKKTSCLIWKAIRYSAQWKEDIKAIIDSVDGVLLDAKVPGHFGGTGNRFNWGIIPNFYRFMASYDQQGWIAGGIKLENIEELLSYHPEAIDLASGIESEQRKSTKIIQQLERKVRNNE